MLEWLQDNWMPVVFGAAIATAVWAVVYVRMYAMFRLLWENERAGNQSARRKIADMDRAMMKDLEA